MRRKAALDAVSRKVAEKIAPKLERLRAAKGRARALREDRPIPATRDSPI